MNDTDVNVTLKLVIDSQTFLCPRRGSPGAMLVHRRGSQSGEAHEQRPANNVISVLHVYSCRINGSRRRTVAATAAASGDIEGVVFLNQISPFIATICCCLCFYWFLLLTHSMYSLLHCGHWHQWPPIAKTQRDNDESFLLDNIFSAVLLCHRRRGRSRSSPTRMCVSICFVGLWPPALLSIERSITNRRTRCDRV